MKAPPSIRLPCTATPPGRHRADRHGHAVAPGHLARRPPGPPAARPAAAPVAPSSAGRRHASSASAAGLGDGVPAAGQPDVPDAVRASSALSARNTSRSRSSTTGSAVDRPLAVQRAGEGVQLLDLGVAAAQRTYAR